MKNNKNFAFLITSIILSLIMIFSFFCTLKPSFIKADETQNNFDCTSKSMCVIEQTSGRVLLQKDKDVQLPMASTTKVMTCLIALENCENLDEPFLTDNRAVGIEGTSIYLKKDEKLTMRELLYGLMLNSGNDAAMAIAYKIGNGKVENFVDLMNKKVEELGLKNTHFDNPHGLDSVSHYTSSYDLCIIASKAMENKGFRDIVKTDVKKITAPKEMGSRFVRNKHKLLKSMLGCEGIKTGFTDNARRCCVTSCKRDNMRLICVVLNCNDMFNESQKCLEKCYQDYFMKTIVEPHNFVDRILVNDGLSDYVKICTQNGFSFPLSKGEENDIKIETNYEKTLDAPIKNSQEVGELKVYFKNDLIFCEKICSIEEVKEKDIKSKMKDIFEQWYLD